MKPRVVITGLGFATPVGRSVEDVWNNLLAGRSGIGPITLFDAGALPVRIGGEVKGFEHGPLISQFPEAAGEPDRKVWLGLDAASRALADAGLDSAPHAVDLVHVGVSLEVFFIDLVAPAAFASDIAVALAERMLKPGQARRIQSPLDRLTRLLADHYAIPGDTCTNCSACAAGAQAIGEAFRRVRGGDVRVALTGAADCALNPLGLGGFSLLRILSTENDRPTRACRPFDATRQGTVLSEGAVFIVLESLEHAQLRGAQIYAEMLGYASSLDAYRVTDPEPGGRGARLSMRRAIQDAGLRPEDIDAVNAHGTGTPKNDEVETRAIKAVLGARAREIPITANKSMTGHMIATSGAFEVAVSALMLRDSRVPPTINLAQPDPLCDLDCVPQRARKFSGQTVLSNSFGFGGQNATLILRRFSP